VSKPFTNKALTAHDQLTVAEIGDLFGFPVSAVLAAIERNRSAIRKSFYSIPDMAKRWGVSRGTVYNVLREAEFKLLNLGSGARKSKWRVPAAVVEHIEKSRSQILSESKEQHAA